MVGSKITHRPHTIMIRKLSELLVPGSTHRPPSPDYSTPTTSPRSPLDYPKIHSPRGLKNFDFDIGGVGLGIVAALHKTITPAGSPEVFAKHSVCCLPKSDPIAAWRKGGGADEQTEICENYTYVTSRGGAGKPCTKVFYDGGESGRLGFPKQETVKRSPKQETAAPTSGGNPEFLSCCDLCRKELHGLDVYMYRGEKGFCSTECRSTQMSIDEQELLQQKLKCRSEARRSAKRNTTTSSSSSSSPPMFSTGILAI